MGHVFCGADFRKWGRFCKNGTSFLWDIFLKWDIFFVGQVLKSAPCSRQERFLNSPTRVGGQVLKSAPANFLTW